MNKKFDKLNTFDEEKYGHLLSKLQQRINYSFVNTNLLKEALTHPSVLPSTSAEFMIDFNRLEFLGDRVLGMIISEYLLNKYASEEVGNIALRYNALVKSGTCSEVALNLEVGSCLRMGKSEQLSGGENKPGILADACEALIGSIYVDGGIDSARKFILTHWNKFFNEQIIATKDAKSTLQEWAHKMMFSSPEYREISEHDLKSSFVVEVLVQGYGSATGDGSTKRAAEQQAAASLLKQGGGS